MFKLMDMKIFAILHIYFWLNWPYDLLCMQDSSVLTSPQSFSTGPALFSLPLAGAVFGRALLVCAPLLGLSESRVSDILLPVTTFTSGAGGCRKN